MRPNNSRGRLERAFRSAELSRFVGIVQKFDGHEKKSVWPMFSGSWKSRFKSPVPSDFDAATAVERELLLRLTSLLWRLRRATAIALWRQVGQVLLMLDFWRRTR